MNKENDRIIFYFPPLMDDVSAAANQQPSLDVCVENMFSESYQTPSLCVSFFFSLQDVLDRALSLASEGDRLIDSSHYAEDSIRPKCSELRAACEEISFTLKSKKTLLLRAMELHHALEKVRV